MVTSALVSLQSKIRLSPGEQKLIALLPTNGKKITTQELTKKYYANNNRRMPVHPRLVVVGMVRTLQKKIESVKAPPFYICSSERAGPYPMEIWRQRNAG